MTTMFWMSAERPWPPAPAPPPAPPAAPPAPPFAPPAAPPTELPPAPGWPHTAPAPPVPVTLPPAPPVPALWLELEQASPPDNIAITNRLLRVVRMPVT